MGCGESAQEVTDSRAGSAVLDRSTPTVGQTATTLASRVGTSDARSSGTSRPTDTSSRASASSGPAPVGMSRKGAWWSPPADSFSAGNIWFFDPVTEARPFGWRRGYQPAGNVPAAQQQFSFVYSQAGVNLALSYPSGTRQSLSIVSYDQSNDALRVKWAGSTENWLGCRSGRMPPAAQAACR